MADQLALEQAHGRSARSAGSFRRQLAALAHRPLLATEMVALFGIAAVLVDSPVGRLGAGVAILALALTGAAAARAQLVGRHAWRWSIAALIGFVAVPLGAAYGVARIVEGTLVGGLLGVVTSLFGLALLVSAAIAAIRGARGFWRVVVTIFSVAVALVYAQIVLMPIAAATVGVHPPRMPIAGETPEDAVAVEIPTPDGARIGAWYTPTANGATLILLPGSMGNRGDTAQHARVLTEHGYGVLALDARGSGTSSEFGNMWGWTGAQDIAGAVAWLDERGVTTGRIGLVGLSMGGEQAVTATGASDTASRVSAVVAEGVSARVPADLWFVQTDLRGQVERLVSTTMWTIAEVWSAEPAPVSLREAVDSNTATPILLIAADLPEERTVAADLGVRSEMVEVWQTAQIGHIQALSLAPVEWEARVLDFLDRELLGR